MMKMKWFENPDNVVYADVDEFADNFGKEVGIGNLKGEIEKFKANPTPDGVNIKGKNRVSLKLFIPDLVFDKHIDMGENVWLYVGETYPAYCIYRNEPEGPDIAPETRNFTFVSNRDCEYFPCHKSADTESFNCLFCYCPLYTLGDKCGGNFKITAKGIKDCSKCMIPHGRNAYDYIAKHFDEISKLAKSQSRIHQGL